MAAYSRSINLMKSVWPVAADHIETIGALSEKLHVPVQEVSEIYRIEFNRLARVARIPNYLGLLAVSNTRSILRAAGKRGTL